MSLRTRGKATHNPTNTNTNKQNKTKQTTPTPTQLTHTGVEVLERVLLSPCLHSPAPVLLRMSLASGSPHAGRPIDSLPTCPTTSGIDWIGNGLSAHVETKDETFWKDVRMTMEVSGGRGEGECDIIRVEPLVSPNRSRTSKGQIQH